MPLFFYYRSRKRGFKSLMIAVQFIDCYLYTGCCRKTYRQLDIDDIIHFVCYVYVQVSFRYFPLPKVHELPIILKLGLPTCHGSQDIVSTLFVKNKIHTPPL